MALKMICSRIKWENDRQIRIINESNLDCLFEMTSYDPHDRDIKDRYLELLSVVKIDNLHENKLRIDSPHLLLERLPLAERDVLERLIRMN